MFLIHFPIEREETCEEMMMMSFDDDDVNDVYNDLDGNCFSS